MECKNIKASVMNYERPIFFDVETSGLDWNKHEITQLSAVEPLSGDFIDVKVKFDVAKADKKALELNHYDEALWNTTAISQKECCVKFQAFCKKHADLNRASKSGSNYKVAALIGHAASKFDMFFITEMFKREGEFLPADYRCYDTLQLALWVCPELTNYNLQFLAEFFEINYTEKEKQHNAYYDVLTTIKITAFLLRGLDVKLPKWARETLKDLKNQITL